MSFDVRTVVDFLDRMNASLFSSSESFLQRNPEHIETFDKMVLLRRAYNADLVGTVPKPTSRIDSTYNDSYVYPFFVESKKAYAARLQNSIDVPITAKFLSSYVGAIVSAGYLMQLDLPPQISEKFFGNIDNFGTTFNVFLAELFSEILLQGKVWILTDAISGLPFTKIIPRESVFEWNYNSEGFLDYFSYYDRRTVFENNIRRFYDVVEVWTPNITTVYYSEIIKDRFGKYIRSSSWSSRVFEHDFSYVPARDAWFGAEAQSILYPVALMQVDYVNLMSEIRQQIRNQGVAILTGPRGFTDQLKAMSVNSAVELDASDRPISWVAYPAFTLQSHFQYLSVLKELMYEIAQNVNIDPAASGISKQWDFLDTQNVLNTAAESIEGLVKQLVSDWFYVIGSSVPSNFSFTVSRDFNSFGVRQTIDNMIAALGVGLDTISELKIKKAIRDKVIKLSPEELQQSDEELEILTADQERLQNELKRPRNEDEEVINESS